MRLVKFRGIRLDDFSISGRKEWCYGYPVPYFKRNDEQLYLMEKVTASSVYGHPIVKETLGQFTGLHDKNGREIYEGDIVRYRTSDERYTKHPTFSILPIHYDNDSAKFMAGDIYWQDLWSPRLEIIGNIHENPELIQPENRSK